MSLFLILISIGFFAVFVNQASVALTTVYLHRGKTHNAVSFPDRLDTAMKAFVLFFTGVVAKEWVAWHRKHHKFPDKMGDPHSPYEHGMWKLFWYKNFLLYRKDTRNRQLVDEFTKGWQDTWVEKLPRPHEWVLVGLVFFLAVFWLMWGAWGLLYGLVSWFLHLLMYIWLNAAVNSICHVEGYRNYTGPNNFATNIRWLSWLTAGEALHNNHHGVQVSPKFSHSTKEVDLGWGIILALSFVGLAEPRWDAIPESL